MEEDIMEDIYYLVHKTDTSKLTDKSKLTELNPSNHNIEKNDVPIAEDQFPGVYFSLITRDNINREQLYKGNYVLIFSCELLKQENYHINIHDNNGFITETNTYYPWNIKDAVYKIASITKKNKKLYGEDIIVNTNNEVVFHDPISMKYCCRSITIPSGLKIVNLPEKQQTYYRLNEYLPKEQIKNEFEPDKSKKPFYCYPQLEEKCYKEDNTKLDETLSSSNNFLETIASVCNIYTLKKNNLKKNKKEIIDEIKTKMGDLYLNREKQNIQALIDFTSNEKKKRIGGSKGKIKSKPKRKVKRKTKRVKKRKRTRTIKRKQK